METGQRIRELRKHQSISQKALAAAVGMSPSFLCDIEQGRTQLPLPRLLAVAAALNTSMDYLVGLDGNSAPIPTDCLATLHTLLANQTGQQLLQALSDFDSWTEPDRQELLQYLKAKQALRSLHMD